MPEEKPEEKVEPYLGTWADKETAESGLANMQTKMTGMGDELGTLREQAISANQTITDLQTKQSQESENVALEYDKALEDVQTEMLGLDDGDPDYHKNLIGLMNKADQISRSAQHEKTLSAATNMFKQELDSRDQKAVHKDFYRDNPDFNTPEMQEQIKARLAQDPTGMEDSLTTYRSIQTDNAIQQAKVLQEENAELKRLATVKEGANQTGKVVVEDGQTTAAQTKPTKLTGADLDKAMLDALEKVK